MDELWIHYGLTIVSMHMKYGSTMIYFSGWRPFCRAKGWHCPASRVPRNADPEAMEDFCRAEATEDVKQSSESAGMNHIWLVVSNPLKNISQLG